MQSNEWRWANIKPKFTEEACCLTIALHFLTLGPVSYLHIPIIDPSIFITIINGNASQSTPLINLFLLIYYTIFFFIWINVKLNTSSITSFFCDHIYLYVIVTKRNQIMWRRSKLQICRGLLFFIKDRKYIVVMIQHQVVVVFVFVFM